MVLLHVAVLPQSSVAVQVRVVLPVPEHAPGTNASEKVKPTAVSHASLTVGGTKTGVAGQFNGVV